MHRRHRITWLEAGRLAACQYPYDDRALRELADRGVRVLVNLHKRSHSPELLARYGLTEHHLPVLAFIPPTPEQPEQGVTAIEQAIAAGQKVAVHCAAGLGRTGTLLACYLVKQGLDPSEALARVREVRPGSVETPEQEAAIATYAREIIRG